MHFLEQGSLAFMCSDEVEIPPEIRPPDQFIDDSIYFPRAQPARAARVESPTFRYAIWQTSRPSLFSSLSNVNYDLIHAIFQELACW